MKPLPIKRIGDLVDQFVEACGKAPTADVLVELEGAYGLDKEGRLALAALGEGDVAADLPVRATLQLSTDRTWESMGLGRFHIRLHRPMKED